jgi:hypothetical protein
MKIILEKTENAINQPTNYLVIADCSGSMWSSIKYLKDTLSATKDLLTPADTISLAWFSGFNKFDWITKGATATANFDALIERNIYTRGMTNYTQVLGSISTVLADVEVLTGHNNNVLLFLSDGHPNDNSPEKDILRICKDLNGKFTNARIIGYSNNYNRRVLLDMAEAMGGQMSHISDHFELDKSYKTFFENRILVKNVALPKKYDLVWQVSNDVSILTQKADNSVDVPDNGQESELFAVDFNELDSLPQTSLSEGKFVYSLAFVLSQKNKANLGVGVLRKAGDANMAKTLRKAFTVAQKGEAENVLKNFALNFPVTLATGEANSVKLSDFLDKVEDNLGNIELDLSESVYNPVTRKGTNVSKVNFELKNDGAKIVQVVANENRANISLLTVRKGQILEVVDAELAGRIEAFNATSDKKITLPIEADTYRNYTLVANGDFNFKALAIKYPDSTVTFEPEKDFDIFDETEKTLKIRDFVNLSKALINEKAHASVLGFYIKQNSEQKHFEDWRVTNYGADGAKLLEEMGIDYAGRYSPKKESIPVEADADYIPFLEIDGYIKGASTVSASTSYKKWTAGGKKPNVADAILFPLFEKYEQLKATLSTELFVKSLQLTLEGVQKSVKMLSRELASIKFHMVTTNSWFENCEKADEFEYDGFVVKVTEQKEYL